MNDACGAMGELLLIISSVGVDERVDHSVMVSGLHVTCANQYADPHAHPPNISDRRVAR
jgi:hypothetical protein